jgi:hypothetical protein
MCFSTGWELAVICIVLAVALVKVPAQDHVTGHRPVTISVETVTTAAAAVTPASLAAALETTVVVTAAGIVSAA